jgi:hypothetical protein
MFQLLSQETVKVNVSALYTGAEIARLLAYILLTNNKTKIVESIFFIFYILKKL